MIELARGLYVVAVIAQMYGAIRLLRGAHEAEKAIAIGSIVKPDADGVPYLDYDADSGLAALRTIRVPAHASIVFIAGILVGFAASVTSTWA